MSVHQLLPLYAVGTLPDDERIAFAAHLGGCAACQAELEAYGSVLETLAGDVAQPPPPGVRDRVLAQIPDIEQEDPLVGPAASATLPTLGPPRHAAPPNRWLAAAAAVLAFALIAATATGVALWQRTARLDAQLAEAARRIDDLGVQTAQSSELAAVLSAPDARLIDVETDLSGDLRIVVADSRDAGAVVADRLEAPPDDRVYQLWLVGDGQPRSAGLLDRGRRRGIVGLLSDVGQAQAVAISIEPVSGSDAPTGPIVGEAALN